MVTKLKLITINCTFYSLVRKTISTSLAWSSHTNNLQEKWSRVDDWAGESDSLDNWRRISEGSSIRMDDWRSVNWTSSDNSNWSRSHNRNGWSSNDLLVTNRILYQYRWGIRRTKSLIKINCKIWHLTMPVPGSFPFRPSSPNYFLYNFN